MAVVLGLAGLIWWGGRLIALSKPMRIALLLLLYGAIVIMQLTLPAEQPLRLATGGSVAPWLIFGSLGLMVFAYSKGLQRLRNRAKHHEEQKLTDTQTSNDAFSETELNRYARHIVMREIGGAGQKKLKQAKVLVIGAGGLGSPVLQYLAASGVGTVGVIDDDEVENTNLQRQVLHTDARIGMAKVFSAEAAMVAQNPYVTVRPYHRKLTEEIATELFADYDLILDGTDNFETRYRVNRTAVALNKPLISGALTQWEGQVSVFHPADNAPCYQCIFPQAPAAELAPSCAEAGVLGPLPGVIGAMMGVEAIKIITGAGTPLKGAMLIYDALYGETRRISLKRDPYCATCGTPHQEN
ncbi:Molybdopterin or thiamine biosynthesis adenylyltransferase [Epibacterium ulvae]|uniref:Molybdopterin-synthase adenylyltransferase n=1 Tax=Epibacterium ulvae TaxID=1156985 RepID=A0A1G5R8M1_9RHOB|nr:molybdopterin-synthase adenylyltransferase MoeB [Epibacterium ulvae]SCZ69649.1 Molybdopterin or thiamine biosynthesis adenylyltransferase [Epibacterium ulvae]